MIWHDFARARGLMTICPVYELKVRERTFLKTLGQILRRDRGSIGVLQKALKPWNIGRNILQKLRKSWNMRQFVLLKLLKSRNKARELFPGNTNATFAL